MSATEAAYVEELETENSYLREQDEWFIRQVFAQCSERIVDDLDPNQIYFEGFDLEIEEQEVKEVPAHKRRKLKRDGQNKITLPPDLPIEQVVFLVADSVDHIVN